MSLFDENAVRKAARELTERDEVLGGVISQVGQLKIPVRETDFECLSSIVVNQQLSGRVADAIFERLKNIGRNNGEFCPIKVSSLEIDALQRCGLSKNKAIYIQGIARMLTEQPDYFLTLDEVDDETAIGAVTVLRGLGIWSAAIFLMSQHGRLDVYPIGDGTLDRAIRKLYGIDASKDREEFGELIESWRPYRSVAARYLWAWIDMA
jgi:DNA-3-methyladenine glycosylase II